eukprot:TRINITY_DN10679_c0_g1_i3.p1 TRINITY_DN10679_c0_g1~~TRINITY_DN10679_c0_g1_i3.p1  ORF type:complete len:515 (-),score=127.85 TRINITY_DN10679_c0_g1_i3:62-1531(-)
MCIRDRPPADTEVPPASPPPTEQPPPAQPTQTTPEPASNKGDRSRTKQKEPSPTPPPREVPPSNARNRDPKAQQAQNARANSAAAQASAKRTKLGDVAPTPTPSASTTDTASAEAEATQGLNFDSAPEKLTASADSSIESGSITTAFEEASHSSSTNNNQRSSNSQSSSSKGIMEIIDEAMEHTLTSFEKFIQEIAAPSYYKIKNTKPVNYIVFGLITLVFTVWLTKKIGGVFKSKPQFRYTVSNAPADSKEINQTLLALKSDFDHLKSTLKNLGSGGAGGSSSAGGAPANIGPVMDNLKKHEDLTMKIKQELESLNKFQSSFQKEILASHKDIWSEISSLRSMMANRSSTQKVGDSFTKAAPKTGEGKPTTTPRPDQSPAPTPSGNTVPAKPAGNAQVSDDNKDQSLAPQAADDPNQNRGRSQPPISPLRPGPALPTFPTKGPAGAPGRPVPGKGPMPAPSQPAAGQPPTGSANNTPASSQALSLIHI